MDVSKEIIQDAMDNGGGRRVSTDSFADISTVDSSGFVGERAKTKGRSKTCQYGCAFWCRKYFWEGQLLKNRSTLTHKRQTDPGDPWHKRFLTRYRRVIGLAIPAAFFHFFWWGVAIEYGFWDRFQTRWPMCVTMVFGSLIAGMTSEGGGAIAFPVMTLVLSIAPSIARDFSMMIQSCGMSAAAFTIFFMGVTVEQTSLILCSLGGAAGMIFGLNVVDPALSKQAKKMGFVSIWFAFATVLVILNRSNKRKTFSKVPNLNWWKLLVLVATGFLGGIFTSFAGSGLDICSFAVLTLLFRISEKVATPTSVILMAGNSLVGFYWREVMMGDIDQAAWDYLAVCVPIVVFGAPIGSIVGSHFHRLVLASMVIIIDIAALIGGFAIVRPLSDELIGASVALIVGFFLIFIGLTFAGQKMMDAIVVQEKMDAAKKSMVKAKTEDEEAHAQAHAEINGLELPQEDKISIKSEPGGVSNVAFHFENENANSDSAQPQQERL